MNIRRMLYSLPFMLLISISMTTADLVESQTDANPEENPGSTMQKMYRLITAGDVLEREFPYVSQKMIELAAEGVTPFTVLSLLPYLMLAQEQVKCNPQALEEFGNAFADLSVQNIDLATLIRDPELIRKTFTDAKCSDLVNDAIQIIAGPKADKHFDLLMDEIYEHLNKNPKGIPGITADELTKLAINSPNFKELFPGDNTQKGLDIINIYMSLIVAPKIKERTRDILIEVSDRKYPQNKGQSTDNVKGFPQYKVKNSLPNATIAFYTVAKMTLLEKMKEKAKEHEEKSKKMVAKWKEDAEENRCNVIPGLWNFVKRAHSEILVFTPTQILQPIAAVKSVVTDEGWALTKIASYFLPVGLAFKALKFICLLTYVTLVAQKEEIVIPHLSKNMKAIVEVPGLNTDTIINTLNNKQLMKKMFPDDSSKNLKVLRFLGGAEVLLVDAIVRQIRIYTAGKKIGEVSVKTILDNHDLVKELVQLNEFNDKMLNSYFNIDSKEEAEKIVEQIQQLKRGQQQGVLKNWVDMGKIRERTKKAFAEEILEKNDDIFKRAKEATQKMKDRSDNGYVTYIINRLPDSWLLFHNAVTIMLEEAQKGTLLPPKPSINN